MAKNSQMTQLPPSTFSKWPLHLLLIVLNGQILASPFAERPPTEFIVQIELGIGRTEEVGANVGQIARRLETICAVAFWRAMKMHLFGRGPIGGNQKGAGGEKTKSASAMDNEGEKGAVTLFPFRVRVIGLSSPQAPSAARPLRLFFTASLNGQMVPANSLFADLSLLSLSEMSAFLRIPIVGISALIQMEIAENAQWWVIALIAGGGILLIGCGWVLLVLYFNLCTVAAIPRERMEEEKDGKKQETEKENRERERREKEEKKEEEKRGRKEREREETERRANEEHTEKKREHDQPQKSTTVSSKSWRRRRKKAPKLKKMVGALRRRNGRGKKKGEMEEEEEEDEAEKEEKGTTEMEGKRRGSEAAGRGRGKDWSFPKNGGERCTTKELGTKSVSVCPKLANPIDAMVRNGGRTAPPSRLRPYWVADQLEGIYHLFQSPSTHPRPGPKAKDGEIRAEIVEG